MTYFLEKNYKLDHDGNLVPMDLEAIIRPCAWDYKTVLKFYAGKMKNATMVLDGQVSSFHKEGYGASNDQPTFKSIEEWLIWVNLNKCISPDFEETVIQSSDISFNVYIGKVVDLHTGKTLDDRTDTTIKKLMDNSKFNIVVC